MKYQEMWREEIEAPDDSFTNTIWALCFSPDGEQALVAVANRILMYNTKKGEIVKALKGHQDTIYALAYSSDGKKFASGGADNLVLLWSREGKGITSYKHSRKIQALSFNPLLQTLASCTTDDFGVYNHNSKFKVRSLSSKCYSLAWAPDGQILALGLTGLVQIKDKIGNETLADIPRGSDPIFALQFTPTKQESGENLLIVSSWDQTLSMFTIKEGRQVAPFGSVKMLNYDPLFLNFMPSGEYFVMGGSDRKITLWTREGVQLNSVAEHTTWIWSAAPHPNNGILFGTHDGVIQMNQINFMTVHGIDRERYAYRDNMIDVIILHLTTQAKVKIKCKDYITKISVYKERVAVQLPDKVVIYSVGSQDPFDMKYKAYKKISKDIKSQILLCCAHHFLVTYDNKIQLYTFHGHLEREWILESTVRFAKVIGGPPRREAVLVAQKNGNVQILLVDNQFPQLILKHSTQISIIDISANRTALAIVDDHRNLYVYNRATQQVIFQEQKVNSVAFNSEFDEMIAYSQEGNLLIKTKDFAPTKQAMGGMVVKLKGSKAFVLDSQSILTVDVPQSSTLYRFIQAKDFASAYRLASLGATEQDWRSLGIAAIKNMEFKTAQRAFTRIKNLKMLALVEILEEKQQQMTQKITETLVSGYVFAFEGQFKEACTTWARKGKEVNIAIEMLISMKMFDVAIAVAKRSGVPLKMTSELVVKQAEWMLMSGEWKKAAEQFISVEKFDRAIEIYGDRNSLESLRDLCKSLDPQQYRSQIRECAKIFKAHRHHKFAYEALTRLGELKELVELHVELKKWEDAFNLAKDHEYLYALIYKPYAEWLIDNDNFQEAQLMFEKANRPDLARQITLNLARNSVQEQRFKDATYYYFMLASNALQAANNPDIQLNALKEYHGYYTLSEIYYAYSFVHQFVEDPFSIMSLGPMHKQTVLNSSRYLVNYYGASDSGKGGSWKGVSMVYVFIALGRIAYEVGAFKTARMAYDRLQTLKVPSEWQEQIDLETMRIRAKPFSDEESLLPICSRCGNTDALINLNGDFCSACKHPNVRSYVGFSELALVEFRPPPNMSHAQVIQLLKMPPPNKPGKPAPRPHKKPKQQNLWEENVGVDQQVLSLAEGPGPSDFADDPFSQRMFDMAQEQLTAQIYEPVSVNEEILQHLRIDEVVIVDLTQKCAALPILYYRNTVPGIPVRVCEHSGKICMQDEFENETGEVWPFCGHESKSEKNQDKDQDQQQQDDNDF